MKPETWRELLAQYRAIAVIRSPNLELGKQMATAIYNGGIRLIEITWNSDRPTELISKLCSELPNCTIGAGTLLTREDVHQAVDSGAEFLFTPHTNPGLIEAARKLDIPMIPGAFSPTEIVTAWQAGASCVKVFPISTLGGVAYVKSLQGPLGEIPLIPTGGVTLKNAEAFISAGAIAVGLSSELFPPALLSEQNWQAIAKQAEILTQQLAKI
ncbi:MAG: bifunctional 4-hydroxy-2-oxoglutarate aldolase/2-dehydro-3-deoxy-phosphogluconate aldolase [Limnoraphis robusta]|uniref:2-dehydro-3-deoxy-phosphogluconate aldolase n=1 Tax=Limnoraphis robusta CS-951 TaxID=1637645 RepID=A0A0F5YK72_9CYAN|nr:bifunctional 4-hydroxy-2-oxoglutarate aldolase/2-dehydro-3-deoxy-phosphogluconate aldolase [Limnoraphis robusta]KKD39324.1 hypothetical protein WN50_04115 [Limnoraphis robusta CS-951]MEA5499032.1 bifunctional 4-hydroxy-2-oxoglutarate aldolase/2-dehydro-3-deoxy-phosphogluconate aldolase [Limnoraphis robusta BA-68 BA1]